MSNIKDQIWIVLLGLLLFIPFQSIHLFDWDEINFAEAAREMLVTGDFFRVTIDYLPFWEKPPLFIWMQALSMHIFGVNEFAARFPNVICGIATLLVLYSIGKKLFNRNFAWFWVMMYAGSFLPHLYFMTGIIDPVFNLFIFLSIYFTYLFNQDNHSNKWILLSGIFLGLAVLTKGPVAVLLYILCLSIYVLVSNQFQFGKMFAMSRKWLMGGVIFIIALFAVCFTYYGVELIRNGTWFIENFYAYHLKLLQTGDAGHGQPFYYHFLVVLLFCLPSSVLLFGSFKRRANDEDPQKDFKLWMFILLAVVLIVFSLVKTKIAHYSSLCYFPITFLAAYYLYHITYKKAKWEKWIGAILIFIGGIFSLALAGIPIVMMNKQHWLPLINDPFAVGSLQTDVEWSWVESIPGMLFLAAIILTLVLLKSNKFKVAFIALLVGTTLATNMAFKLIVPKAESITQGVAIEFYKSLKDEDCYVEVLNFKSYAHLFYTTKQPVSNEKSRSIQWLLHGDIDKPVYLVCKNTAAEEYRKMEQLEEIKEKNGFVFFKRSPPIYNN